MAVRLPDAKALCVDPSLARRTGVVLLHGLCSTPDELISMANGLGGAGYSVHPLAVDGYSFDATRPVRRATPWREGIDTIEHCVEALRIDHDWIMLVGISAGAALALATAIRCPRVDALVLLSTTLRFDGWAIPRRHKLLPLALNTPLGRFWRYRERAPYGVKNERVREWIERELRHRKVSRAGAAVIWAQRCTPKLKIPRKLMCSKSSQPQKKAAWLPGRRRFRPGLSACVRVRSV
jgi:carboxylesterase